MNNRQIFKAGYKAGYKRAVLNEAISGKVYEFAAVLGHGKQNLKITLYSDGRPYISENLPIDFNDHVSMSKNATMYSTMSADNPNLTIEQLRRSFNRLIYKLNVVASAIDDTLDVVKAKGTILVPGTKVKLYSLSASALD